jgi:aryl-alcohol dehydrogenase-like predicted oxidoreductase
VRTVAFGRTGLEITRVGFGAWAIGGGNWEFGWGAQDDEESIAAIHGALALGVDWIDTAAQYGLGHSEEIVRRALEGVEPRPLVFTKGGQPEGPKRSSYQTLKRDSLRRECEGSLERLGVDALDLYQIHWPIPDEEVEEGWAALAEVKDEGLVRHIGVSNFSVEQLERAAAIAPVDTLQPPYSLLDREIEDEILPYCLERGIGVIVYSPMSSGLLTGRMTRERIAALPPDDWRGKSARFQEPQLSEALELVERLQRVADRHGVSPGAVAVAWTLRHPAVDGAIVGFRRPDQLDPIVVAAELELSDEDVAEILGESCGTFASSRV